MMFYFEIIVIALQFANTITRHHSSSEESIENLLYFKDCKKTTVPPLPLRIQSTPAPKPEIFCTMCCGDNCLTSQASSMRNQKEQFQSLSMGMAGRMAGLNGGLHGGMNGGMHGHGGMNGGMHGHGGIGPPPISPPKPSSSFLHNMQNKVLPEGLQAMKRSHRMRPFPLSRRSLSKEYLKNIISQDQDIKKILKDLVRVTMQKLDLEQMLNSRNTAANNVKSSRRKEQETLPLYKDSESEPDTDANDVETDYDVYEYDYD